MSTGVVYDPVFLKHDQFGHPEHAGRLKVIIEELQRSNLNKDLINVPVRHAAFDELLLCHTQNYVDNIISICHRAGGYLDSDTYTNEFTFEAASKAVGGLINLATDVVSGKLNNGIALLRPPGHHALASRAMGFCIFGNVAIAAKYAIEKLNINKAAIVDFDVHHGNGTQALVENSEKIIFISTHQYPFYPGSGAIGETGLGNVVNIPLPSGTGDEGFRLVYDEIVIPVLRRFQPEIIFVSAGYDAHWNDPLASLMLTLNGFARISEQLNYIAKELCDGKIIFSLEGGYNLEALSAGITNSIKVLLGRKDFVDNIDKPSREEINLGMLISNLRSIHKL